MYTLKPVQTNTLETEMDHVLELQCVRDCYDVVTKHQGDFRLRDMLRSKINIVENLNFTTKSVNLLKCVATQSFLSAYRADNVHELGIFHYLQEAREATSSLKLTRKESGNIQGQILQSYDACVDNMEPECDLLLQLSCFCDELHDMVVVKMDLK
jgi:hypothetical protein